MCQTTSPTLVKLSNKGRYGVQAVFDIAFHNDGRPTQIKVISARQGIPPRFLEQIFQELKRSGLVTSKRGPKGGYALALPPEEISVGAVVRALEGPTVLTSPDEGRTGDAASRAVTEAAFADLGDRRDACFDDLTIGELCERGQRDGLRRRAPRRHVYSI